MREPEATPAATHERLSADLAEAESKAWDALCRYKFMQFGYWAAVWVHLARIAGGNRPNPWGDVVAAARQHSGFVKVDGRRRGRQKGKSDG